MDKGTLYRLALSKLGSNAELVEGTPQFEALEECSQQAVAFALDYSAWDFATKGPISLPLVDGEGVLPGDCLELRSVGLKNWKKIGRRIISDNKEDQSADIIYKSREISDTLALPDHEPLWCEAVVTLVAASVAGRVTGLKSAGHDLQQVGMQLLYRASLKEARQVSSNDQEPKLKKGGMRWVMA